MIIRPRHLTLILAGLTGLLLKGERPASHPSGFEGSTSPPPPAPDAPINRLFRPQAGQVKLDFAVEIRIPPETGISDESTGAFRPVAGIVLGLAGQYYRDEVLKVSPRALNPFETFETNMMIDPEMNILLVEDLTKAVREALEEVRIELARRGSRQKIAVPPIQYVSADAFTLTVGFDLEDGTRSRRVICLVGYRQILESARSLYGELTVASYNTALLAALSHELVGHLPAVLSGEETFPRRGDEEEKAFRKTISFFEWILQKLRGSSSADPMTGESIERFERALKRERELLARVTGP